MNERVLGILEFDKIRLELAQYTNSSIGHALACTLVPSSDTDEVRTLQTQTLEAEAIYRKLGRSPIESFEDMRETLKRSHAVLALSPGELLGIARTLRCARLARECLAPHGAQGILKDIAARILPQKQIEEEISRCIMGEDEILDSASVALSQIRRHIRASNERIRDKLNSMLSSSTYAKYLQEPIITLRNGRYVVPVKQESRQFVPGLVHDQSGSGATLFIEPMAVVEIGNELKRLLGEEQAEIERILAELTSLISPIAAALINNLDLLGALDVIFAKAVLAREMSAIPPVIGETVRIAAGRHPLIAKDKVVPIDLWLGEDFTSLIITGPNTGGKTVTLKTAGLFTLMMQSGLMIPAQSANLRVFGQVFADIGDEQSIEQSLSTFSSHMKNIVNILNEADDSSLVLLDELGAGTDPNEGAALAMAILDSLSARGCVTLATTHYSELKAFALTRPGMENASMEFDVATLRPTYRLFIGIPGSSNAFEISARLGLDESVINSARKFLKREDISFEEILSSAESQRKLAEQDRRLAEEARVELERLHREAEAEREKLAQQREKLLTKAKDEAREIVRRAKDESERVIRDLRMLHSAGGKDERSVQQARDALRKSETDLAPGITGGQSGGEPLKDVLAGQTVYVTTLDQTATVLSKPNKGEVLIQAGIVKLTAKLSDLRATKEPKQKHIDSSKIKLNETVAGAELHLRGKTLSEALLDVDLFLDTALTSGLSEVRLIHGKGTGALRAGISDYIKRDPRVKEFRLGRYGEGESGVTIVTL